MGIWNFARSFEPMNGKVPDFDLEAEWYGVNPAEIHAPAGDSLQLTYSTSADKSLEGISGRVPG
jgi:hypothetical protein